MGPYKCPDCGVWWAGFEHRCQIDLTRLLAASRLPDPDPELVDEQKEDEERAVPAHPDRPVVIRNVPPYPVGSGSTTAAPYCAICAGWHIPGAGPCTATWSKA